MSLEITLSYITKAEYDAGTPVNGTPANALIMKEFENSNNDPNDKEIYLQLQISNSGNTDVTPSLWYSIPSTDLTLLDNYTEITLAQSSTDIVSKLDNNILELSFINNGNVFKLTSSRQSLGVSIPANGTEVFFGYISLMKNNSQFDIFKGSFDINVEET